MRHLTEAEPRTFEGVRFVLTDMDETLTLHGRLHARTYQALERLQQAGIVVIPVTAAPAGWCDQMARMWPVDGVIGENGAFFFRRGMEGQQVVREFWLDDAERTHSSDRLATLRRDILHDIPDAVLADDCAFRLSSVAFARPSNDAKRRAIVQAIWRHGAIGAVNNLWVVASQGGFDKLKMSTRVLHRDFGVDIETQKDAIAYVGDSANDAPMFEFLKHTVGVSTVADCLDDLPVAPAWITDGAGGDGFVEVADAILRVQARPASALVG